MSMAVWSVLLQRYGLTTSLRLKPTITPTWFRKHMLVHVARVKVIAPRRFEMVRCSIKEMNKNDARTITSLLNKNMFRRCA